jgi:hypothetical protein
MAFIKDIEAVRQARSWEVCSPGLVDAQIVLAMFLTRHDRPNAASSKRQLLNLLAQPTFHWLWTPVIRND